MMASSAMCILTLLFHLVGMPSEDSRPEVELQARGILLERSASQATVLVLVDNKSSVAVNIPQELQQYIAPSWLYEGMFKSASRLPICSDPNDRGVVTLGPGYSYGMTQRIDIDLGVKAVRFEIDLGEALGRLPTPWIYLKD